MKHEINNYILIVAVDEKHKVKSYSCSIVSRDIPKCSYRLSFLHLTSSHLSSAEQIFIGENHPIHMAKPSVQFRNGENLNGDNCGHG